MNYLTSLALKNVRRHPVQSLLTILGISLSVAVILAVFMINAAMQNSVEKTAEELGTGKTGIWIQELTEDVASIGSKQEGFSDALINEVLKNSSVASVHPSVKVYTSYPMSDISASINFYIYGIRLEDDRVVRNHLLSKGQYPQDTQEIMIGEKLAKELNADVGSTLSIPSPKGILSLQVSGLLSPKEGTGTLNNNRIIFADLETVQKFFGYENKMTALNVVLKSGVVPAKVLDQFMPLLPVNISAFTDPLMDVTASDSTEKLKITAFVFAFISIFIAVFVIYNTLSSSVEQSRKELGLLRLIGMNNKQIIKYFLNQSLIYSVIGSLLGIFLGLALGAGLLRLVNVILKYQSLFIEPPTLTSVFISAGVGIAATLIVGLFPAIKASKTSPMSVFRNYEEPLTEESRFSKKNLIALFIIVVGVIMSYLPTSPQPLLYIRFIGPVLILSGVCLILDILLPFILRPMSHAFSKVFGLSGLLAIQSLQLRLKRTVITVSSIMVAVSIFIGVIGSTDSMKITVTDWYNKTQWADVIIFSASGAEINDSIIDKVSNFNFIEKINPMRYYFVPYSNGAVSDNGLLFQGVEPSKFQDFADLAVTGRDTSEALKELETGHAILVNRNLSKMLGLKVGENIDLDTKQGPVSFKIVGEVDDYSDFMHRMGKVVYGSYDNLVNLWGVNGYTVIQLRLAEGYTQEQAQKLLMEELSGQYNIKVITHEEEKEDVGKSLDQIFSIPYALNIIIFIIVFMGIFNTLLINVLFQIREFAVLRIIGCFSKQIRSIVMYEALGLGFIGSILASLTGLWLSKQMSIGTAGIMGTVLNYYTPVSALIILFIVTLIVSMLATLYPQKLASGISISKVMQSIDDI